jgi:hypothetical protein
MKTIKAVCRDCFGVQPRMISGFAIKICYGRCVLRAMPSALSEDLLSDLRVQQGLRSVGIALRRAHYPTGSPSGSTRQA